MFYTLYQGVWNLVHWFKLIWRDNNGNDNCILIMMHQKLKYMYDAIYNGQRVGCKKDAKSIKTCYLLLERIIEDDYGYWAISSSGSFLDNTRKTTIQPTLAFSDFRGYVHYGQYMMKQDMDLLFKLMNKHILSWWD